jgi:phosphoglycolate phosphatase
MISLCIFDLDGTLSNTLDSLVYFCNTALTRCGLPAVPDRKAIQYMVGSGVHTLLRRLLTASVGENYTEDQFEELFAVYSQLYQNDPMHLVREYDGVREVLAQLQDQGVKLAVFSNKPDAMTKRVVSSLYPEIDFAVCRGQVDGFPKKPAPDGLWAILEETETAPEDCLYIGDSDIDMATGINAKVKTVGVTWGFRTAEELRASGGTLLIDQPQQLLPLVAETK